MSNNKPKKVKYVRCPACRRENEKYIIQEDNPGLFVCPQCGNLFVRPEALTGLRKAAFGEPSRIVTLN